MGFIVSFLNMLITALTFAIIGRALLSWVDPGTSWPITRLLHEITEPVVSPIRQIMPNVGMFDFSPMIAILLLQLVGQTVVRALAGV